MIVGINARILATQNIRGWSRYTCNLISGLHKRNIHLVLFSDQPIEKRWIPLELHQSVIVQKGYNYIHWEQFVLPQLCEKYKVDILHCPTNYGLPVKGTFKKILTLHDAIEKSYYDQFKTLGERWSWLNFKIRSLHTVSQGAADHIVTVSEFAKQDIVEHYSVPAQKLSVIYEAADSLFSSENVMSASDLRELFKITPGYYFYVGGFEKRKNIPLLLKAAERLHSAGFRLVIAGGDSAASVPNNVQCLGYVEEKYLPSLYAHSTCLLYPSFHEGFGLQLVESLQMGRPALYANTTSLPEIYGTMEYGFSPDSVDELLASIARLEKDYSKALHYAQSRKLFFSWGKTIDKTMALYESVLR